MGILSYEHYLFLNMITEARGGLEHRASSLLMTSRWQMRARKGYLDWLTLVSHELFHAWNVKRRRPVELGPFDYERAVHTRSLWVAEGLTAYYGALLVHRAGLSTRDEYLSELSSEIRDLQTTPGRLVQSVEQASYDAWTKYYRRNENSSNTTVSYYTKGAVIGFLLDAKIRRTTGGASKLDDALRLAYERFSGDRGFTPAEFRKTVEDAAATHVDIDPWFVETLETPAELDYREALDWFGLGLAQTEVAAPHESPDEGPLPGWLGLEAAANGDNVVVSVVARDTPRLRCWIQRRRRNPGHRLVPRSCARLGVTPATLSAWPGSLCSRLSSRGAQAAICHIRLSTRARLAARSSRGTDAGTNSSGQCLVGCRSVVAAGWGGPVFWVWPAKHRAREPTSGGR